MKIEIENKDIVTTATAIGIAFTEISEQTTSLVWSLIDENGFEIQQKKETFDSGSIGEIIDALFKKLSITKKIVNNATNNTTTGDQ
jgi:hypothetical protein